MTTKQTTQERCNTCAAQARWNTEAGAVDLSAEFKIVDWKKFLPSARVAVDGRPDLLVSLHPFVLLGEEELWPTPDGGMEIDYSSADGSVSVGLVSVSHNKPLPSHLSALDESTQSLFKRFRKKTTRQLATHQIRVGNAFSFSLTLRLVPACTTSSVERRPKKDPWVGAFDDFWD